MATYKVWFEVDNAKFALEFKGQFSDVCNAANTLAPQLDAIFNYEIYKVSPNENA